MIFTLSSSIHSRTHQNLEPNMLELPLQGHLSPSRGQIQWSFVHPDTLVDCPSMLPLSSPSSRKLLSSSFPFP